MSLLRIVGIGNPERGDDAAGLVAAEKLRALLPMDVAVHQHTGDGASLMLLWEPCDDVVLIDAVTSGAAPGTVHRRDLLRDPFPPGMRTLTTHAFGVEEAVELARALHRLPASLRLIGIEAEDFSIGSGLSDAVLRAVETVAEERQSLVTRHSSPVQVPDP